MSQFDPSYNILDVSGGVFYNTVFAFTATGGYSTVQGFQRMERLTEAQVNIFDTTGSVQFQFPVGLLNSKLGLYKAYRNGTSPDGGFFLDATNSSATYYDSSNNVFTTDSIAISASDFVANLPSPAAIVSVGRLSSAYLDFADYVAAYFNITGPTISNPSTGPTSGFSGLFSNVYDFNPNNGVFDASALYQIIQSTGNHDPVTLAGINALSGTVTISNITKLLRYAVDADPFGNRDPSSNFTALDATQANNFGVSDGFLAGDIIFVPNNGFAIQFNVNIDYSTTVNNYVQNNPNADTITYIDSSLNNLANFHQTTVQNKSYIGRQISTPLLFRLVDSAWVGQPLGDD